MMRKQSVRIDDESYEWFKNQSKEEGRTITGMIYYVRKHYEGCKRLQQAMNEKYGEPGVPFQADLQEEDDGYLHVTPV